MSADPSSNTRKKAPTGTGAERHCGRPGQTPAPKQGGDPRHRIGRHQAGGRQAHASGRLGSLNGRHWPRHIDARPPVRMRPVGVGDALPAHVWALPFAWHLPAGGPLDVGAPVCRNTAGPADHRRGFDPEHSRHSRRPAEGSDKFSHACIVRHA